MYQDAYNKIATISAPGKVILCGQHAVVYGEDALALAISLRCTATVLAKQSSSSALPTLAFTGSLNCTISTQMLPKNIPQQFTEFVKMSQHEPNEHAKLQYKIGTFLKQTGFEFANTNRHDYIIDFKSDIPIGKCLGSSASFNTVLTSVLFVICSPGWQKKPDLHQINRISKIMERIEHGTPSGIDNFVATFGGLVLFNNSKNPPFNSISEQIVIDRISSGMQMRLVDSGVEKNTKNAVAIVRKNCESDEKYKIMIKQIGGFASRILGALGDQQKEGWLDEIMEIMSQNHRLLRQLGVSIPQMEEIVSKNTVSGRRSAKITGSGLGGYVLIVQDPKDGGKEGSGGDIITKLDRRGVIMQYY